MAEWLTSSLGDIADLRIGKTPPRGSARYWSPEGGYPWATIADLRNDPVMDTAERVSEDGLTLAGRSVAPGSVLLSFKLTIGRIARAGVALQTNEAIASVHAIKGVAEDSWLYHALPLVVRDGIFDTAVKGPTLNMDKLQRLGIRVPPLAEQRRIAEILDSIDYAIRASERVLAKLDDLGSALLAELALQCADNGTPVPLNATGVWLSGGTPNTNEPSFWDGPIPWITASSLRGKYLSRSSRTLTAAGVRSGSRLVPSGTLICVVRGMSLKSEFRVGIAAVQLAFGQDCKALRPTGDWLPAYLHLQLSARESEVLRLVDEASHGTGRLQMPLLGALLVDLISPSEQQRVVALFQAHEERVSAEEAELAKLRQLRAGLAEDLLSGRVRTVAA